MNRILAMIALVCLFALAGVAGASAARNPSDKGPPSVECGDLGATSAPPGFAVPGFAKAELHYAPGSQYDVACYQQTQNGH